MLAWGKNNHYPTESKASKKEDVSNVESTNSMISTENVPVTDISPNKPMIEEDNRTTPDEFIEALASIENLTSKSMIEEDSETVADDFIETLVSNEILAIAEEREIQLAPEFHSILNYDPKEAEYVRSTPELLRDVDTQSQSQHSFTTPEQIDNSKDDDEILLFVSSRKSGKHSTKSPIRRATNQYIIVSPSQSSPIRSVNRYIPSSPSKTVTTQHIATSPAQTSRSIPSPNSSPVRSVNKYIPVSKSRASATQTPIRTKPGKTGTIINAKYQHQSISPVKTAAIKKPVRIIPIKQKIVKDPKIANRVKAAYVKTASTKNPIETNSIKTAKKETIVTGLVKKLSNQHKTKSPIQTGPNTGDTMACPSVSTLLNYQDSNTESADWASNVCMSSGVYNINNNYTVESSDHKKRHLESVPKMVQTIEVSEIMPQKPYRKKLRLANPKKVCKLSNFIYFIDFTIDNTKGT